MSATTPCGLRAGAVPGYQTDASTVAGLAAELRRALPPEHRQAIADPPLFLVDDPSAFVRAVEYREGGESKRGVFVSAGFVHLANYLAHAQAADKVQRGSLRNYVASLSQQPDGAPVPAPDFRDRKFWTVNVMNEQMSSFNQIVGAVVATRLAHHYLGQYRKYAVYLNNAQSRTVSITELLTPAEFDQAVAAGTQNALNCGIGVEGFKALLEAIDSTPHRPAWTTELVQADAKISRLKRDLVRMERKFFAGAR